MCRKSPSRLVLLCLAAFYAAAFADVVVLNSGEKIEGKVTAETDTEITIAAKVTASITDERVIKKSEIQTITKDTPDEIAWESLKNLKPGKNSLPVTSYDSALNPLKGFLTEYPQSKFAAEAQKAVDAFTADKKRVEAGEVKLDDKWLSKEETQKERVQINGLMAFNHMKEQSTRDMTAAMNTMDAIEKNFAGTRSYPDAIEYAQKMLPALKAEVDRRIKAATERKAEREKTLAKLTGPEKTTLQDEIKREQTAADAAVSAAEKQGLKWVPLNAANERALQNLASKVPSELQRLNSQPVAKMRASLAAADKAKNLMDKKDMDGAETALTQAMNDWPGNELATRIQPELKSAKAALAAATAAAAAAAAAEPAPAAPVALPPRIDSPTPDESATVRVEKEKPFLLTPGGAVTVVIAVAFLVAAFNAFKKIKGKANDVLE